MRDWRSEIHGRLASLDLAPAVEADIVEEIAQHLEDELIEACARGESEEEATNRFLNAYDAVELQRVIRERRSARASLASPPVGAQSRARNMTDAVRRDLVYGWRSLWRSKGATIAIILSLGIVIGANTAIFGLVDSILLRRLPLPNPAQLVAIVPTNDGHPISVSYLKYKLLKGSAGIGPLAAFRFEGATVVTPTDEHADMWIDHVSGDYFQLLGVKPLVGRLLSARDESDAAPVAVVSQEFWTQHLGARKDVLGQTLKLNDLTVTVVGVTAEPFTGINFARRLQIAVPVTVTSTGFVDQSLVGVSMIARMNGTGARPEQAASIERTFRSCCLDADNIYNLPQVGRARQTHFVHVDDPPLEMAGSESGKEGTGFRVLLNDASTGLRWGVDLRARYRDVLLATMGAVLLLLLIACANVATLLLARGAAREREFAVRRSLGASANRIRTQLLVEGLELALAGSVLGFSFAVIGTRLLARALPTSAARLEDVIVWRSSGAVIGFTATIMILCAVATSLWPARRAAREELLGSLTGARRRVARGWGADRVLVVAQVTLAIVLTTAAGLYVSTVHNLTKGGRGYGTRNILLGQLDASQMDRDPVVLHRAFDALLQKAKTLPGVESAVLAFNAPVFQDGLAVARVKLPGSLEESQIDARLNVTSPGFFAVTGVGLVSGRDFSASDDALAPAVVIVSTAFERRYYGQRSAVGQTVLFSGKKGRTARIIGVARDAGYDRLMGQGSNLRDLRSDLMYQPPAQYEYPLPTMTLIIRTPGDPLDVAPSMRHVTDGTPDITVRRITGIGQLLDDAASRERFAAALATGFGVLALILTAVGVFGVLWFNVSQRTKEIGIRMALGAQPADAMRLVLRQSLSMTALAVALGVPLAAACAWVVRAQFYGVRPAEPLALIGSAALLTTIAIIASVVPSRHAARVDPLVALREDG